MKSVIVNRASASQVAAVRSNLAHYYKCYFKKNFKPEDFAVRALTCRILRDAKAGFSKLQNLGTASNHSFQNVDTGALFSAFLCLLSHGLPGQQAFSTSTEPQREYIRLRHFRTATFSTSSHLVLRSKKAWLLGIAQNNWMPLQ